MQLNYDNIRKRVDDLPVTAELKADLIDGIESCQQFTVIDCSFVMAYQLLLFAYRAYPFLLDRAVFLQSHLEASQF